MMAIEILGGMCAVCGTVNNLEIDHVDPLSKEFDLGTCSRSEAEYWEELKKCQALCRECHIKKSAAELSVVHGGGMSGKKNCKCRPCKDRKNEYMKAYKRSRREASARN